jgi:hypothetical protein
MNRTDSIYLIRKELSHRDTDGIEVSLLWAELSDRLFVVVRDRRSNETFELEVDAADALDVFEHPYAHAAFRGLQFRSNPPSVPERRLSRC